MLLIFLIPSQISGQSVLYKTVSFKQKTASTAYFLSQIEKQGEVVFSYSNKLCFSESITLSKNSGSIREILNELFISCPSNFIVKGPKIIIEPYSAEAGKFIIRGFIRDSESKESLIQANIYEPDQLLGTVSNNFGFYSLTLPAGLIRLQCSYVGFKDEHLLLNLRGDTTINFYLKTESELGQIDVVGSRVPGRLQSTRTGTIDVPIEQIKNVPVFLGEVDIVKSIQLLPGIQSGGEGLSEMYVRGGGPDQNLVLMDDVPVYNVGHLLGFFSIFNADAINHVSVIKGGFPARYGGRLSSVVDIRLNDGNMTEHKGVASVGLLSSRLSVEGPLVKDKSSYSVSFRRTYFDLFTGLLQYSAVEKSRYYFYDFNAKFNYKLSKRDRLFFSAYAGKDQYGLQYNEQKVSVTPPDESSETQFVTTHDNSDVGWKNYVASTRWNHIYGDRMFSNLTLTYSDYRFFIQQRLNYQTDGNWSIGTQNYYSGIRDFSVKADFDYFPSPKHYLRFGANLTMHTFYPGVDLLVQEISGGTPIDTAFGGKDVFRPELRTYIEDDFKLSDKLKLNIGAHFSLFRTENQYYWSAEPRLSGLYLINDNFSIKAAYSHMTQYMHLLRTASVAMPTDLWLPVSDNIKPMRASQGALGLEYEFNRGFSLAIEGYYKRFHDILAYKEAAGYFDFASDWEDKLTSGEGLSRGVEILLHKKTGKLSGWIGYTYSKTTNQFEGLNGGREFAADFDRTHDLSIFGNYKFSKKVDMGLTWTFGTGSPITLPETKYYAPDLPTGQAPVNSGFNQFISERNGYRMPNFHRLDVGFNFNKVKSYGSRTWSLGVMNLYGRQNPFFLYFADSENEQTGELQRSLKQFSLFPFPIPYLRLTVRF
ncbi:TonB-dependent receptor [Carboxylicivirga sp. N1Y90]|uniref:TonB-dependent receptor n=1 Tax=Carboxylicivirga fragile TaxID=3417571 RepID=UPI003D33FCF9|nr:TonB-dependent receptor plug domain-containing protein [Marinilabiliaceae bacterium N1Y90]